MMAFCWTCCFLSIRNTVLFEHFCIQEQQDFCFPNNSCTLAVGNSNSPFLHKSQCTTSNLVMPLDLALLTGVLSVSDPLFIVPPWLLQSCELIWVSFSSQILPSLSSLLSSSAVPEAFSLDLTLLLILISWCQPSLPVAICTTLSSPSTVLS